MADGRMVLVHDSHPAEHRRSATTRGPSRVLWNRIVRVWYVGYHKVQIYSPGCKQHKIIRLIEWRIECSLESFVYYLSAIEAPVVMCEIVGSEDVSILSRKCRSTCASRVRLQVVVYQCGRECDASHKPSAITAISDLWRAILHCIALRIHRLSSGSLWIALQRRLFTNNSTNCHGHPHCLCDALSGMTSVMLRSYHQQHDG
mmetsp:Transcript_10910/g.30116  ORF Transcript_10910/g.30116 Transcript_10910/m.30116 type:complete len:202 (+) Transcript_10910:1017-1622(+)